MRPGPPPGPAHGDPLARPDAEPPPSRPGSTRTAPIAARLDPGRPTRDVALTDRPRTEGTRNPYEAVEAVEDPGVTKTVAQGLAYAYDPAGGSACGPPSGPRAPSPTTVTEGGGEPRA
ncbi:hypothetical protein AB0D71_34350 [Streptomyces avermitilis]|uniref:hypothetical protein n=1 Tax=Streptomyces avermitilis TaxID=33903 RepID=UPI003406B74C